MKIRIDTLELTKMLEANEFPSNQSRGLVESLSQIEIHNLLSQEEVNAMLSEAIRNVFQEQKEALAEQRAEFERRASESERRAVEQRADFLQQMERDLNEARTNRRWVVGTIITVGIVLGGYLSAMIHFSH